MDCSVRRGGASKLLSFIQINTYFKWSFGRLRATGDIRTIDALPVELPGSFLEEKPSLRLRELEEPFFNFACG